LVVALSATVVADASASADEAVVDKEEIADVPVVEVAVDVVVVVVETFVEAALLKMLLFLAVVNGMLVTDNLAEV
jgi:hypothetical protein